MTLPSVRTWASTGSILSALNELGAFGKAIARRVKRSPNFPTCRRSAKWLSRSVFMGGLRGPEGNTSRFVDRFAAEVNKVLASDEVKNRLLEVGALPAGGSPEDAARFQRSELAKWKEVVEVSGAKME